MRTPTNKLSLGNKTPLNCFSIMPRARCQSPLPSPVTAGRPKVPDAGEQLSSLKPLVARCTRVSRGRGWGAVVPYPLYSSMFSQYYPFCIHMCPFVCIWLLEAPSWKPYTTKSEIRIMVFAHLQHSFCDPHYAHFEPVLLVK